MNGSGLASPRLDPAAVPRRPGTALAVFLVAILLVAACAGAAEDEWEVVRPVLEDAETTRIAGPVTYMDLEGGLYVIRGPDGTNYNPTNLPEAYRQDGLFVQAEVIRRDDVASIGMVGPVVEIVRIRRVDDAADGDASSTGGDAAPATGCPPGGIQSSPNGPECETGRPIARAARSTSVHDPEVRKSGRRSPRRGPSGAPRRRIRPWHPRSGS